jgi:hypothetical protein
MLEISTGEPRQYRLTVLEDNGPTIMNHMLNRANNDGFRCLGYFDTPEGLMKVLIPYLQMEDSK